MFSILLQSALLLPQGVVGATPPSLEIVTPNSDFLREITAQEAETSNWSGAADLGLTFVSGNNESSNSAANLTAACASGLNVVDLGAHYAGTRTTDAATNNASTTSRLYLYDAAYNRYFSTEKNFYGYATGSSRENEPNGLQMRNTIGLGLGYTYHLYENATLDLEAGSSYVAENKVGTLSDSSVVGRGAYKFATPIYESVDFTGAGTYLKGGDIETYEQDLGVNWALNATWSLVASYNIAWDGNPSAGFSSTDRRFNLFLSTKF